MVPVLISISATKWQVERPVNRIDRGRRVFPIRFLDVAHGDCLVRTIPHGWRGVSLGMMIDSWGGWSWLSTAGRVERGG